MAEEPLPKLRMAPAESAEELARRYEREHRASQLQREERLSNSLAPFRVGSVPYLTPSRSRADSKIRFNSSRLHNSAK